MWLRLRFSIWKNLSPSDEICPCCGIQYGYDDAAAAKLRSSENPLAHSVGPEVQTMGKYEKKLALEGRYRSISWCRAGGINLEFYLEECN